MSAPTPADLVGSGRWRYQPVKMCGVDLTAATVNEDDHERIRNRQEGFMKRRDNHGDDEHKRFE